MSKKELIIEEIRKIYDPELPVNIYELGLIYDIVVENEKSAKIKMTLTTPSLTSLCKLSATGQF
jgi:metal-sulfur cluster biosynthetic enzyme